MSPGASTLPLSVVEREGRTRPAGEPKAGSLGDRMDAAADANRGAGLKPDEPTADVASSDITVSVLAFAPTLRPEPMEPDPPPALSPFPLAPAPPMLSETVGSISVSHALADPPAELPPLV